MTGRTTTMPTAPLRALRTGGRQVGDGADLPAGWLVVAQEVTVTRSGNSLKVAALAADLDWTLKLVGIRSVASAGGAGVKPGDDTVVTGRGAA